MRISKGVNGGAIAWLGYQVRLSGFGNGSQSLASRFAKRLNPSLDLRLVKFGAIAPKFASPHGVERDG